MLLDEMSRLAPIKVHVTPAAESILRRGHPWLFSDSIKKQSREGGAGEPVVVYDRNNRFLGIGVYDPGMSIRVRLLHTGKPQTLDRVWWEQHLIAALERRADLFDAETNGYRLCNGENDGWPGVILDRYAGTLVIKLYSAAWFPWLEEIADLICTHVSNERLVLRLSRNIQDREEAKALSLTDGQILRGASLTGPVVFMESGIQFYADVLKGQKTGFFLDQRENRRLVESLSAGRHVLNTFSFSGAFSLYAARGGALSVTDLDISAHALDSSERNFELNRSIPSVAACRHELCQADVFEWMAGQEGQGPHFDLVILDPPSLAKREVEREEAIRVYGRLARSAVQLIRPGGVLVASSCSAHVSADEFRTAVLDSVQKSGRMFTVIRTTEHAPDHPATFPEGHYLKTVFVEFSSSSSL